MHEESFGTRKRWVRAPLDASHIATRGEAVPRVPGSGLVDVPPGRFTVASPRAGSLPATQIEHDPRFRHRLISDPSVAPVFREQYRRLAASLHQLHSEGLSIVMVASAMPREGKTLTAVNLALTFSESYGREVLLIDADLRRPLLHDVFGVANDEGLNEFLAGPAERHLPVRQIGPRLSLLPGGLATADPMGRLTSPRMKRVFTMVPEAFDWVIVDTPAMGILPDAWLLASMVDGVLLVVSARSTPYAQVKRAVDTMGRGRIVGIVLNRADSSLLGSQAGQYDFHCTRQGG